MTWLTSALSVITETVTTLLGSLGTGTVGFFEDLFTDGLGDISTLGAFMFITIGIGFVTGIIGWVSAKLSRKG